MDSFINNTAISYVYIFKGNSENIHASFAQYDDKKSLIHSWDDIMHYYISDTPKHLRSHARERYHVDNLKIFTFLRNPLDHFLSGLVESYFRRLHVGSHPNITKAIEQKMHKREANIEVARRLLHSIILTGDHNYAHNKLAHRSHYYLMSYALLKWKPTWIGYLEEFKTNWTDLNSYLDLQVKYLGAHHHATSDDPMDLRKSLVEVFQKMPYYLRAVCRLLMVDYVCLKFELPPECANMTATHVRRL